MSGPGLDVSRSTDRQLQRLDFDRREIQSAGPRNLACEGVPGDFVDLDVARSGNGRAGELRNGDDEVNLAMMAPAPVKEAVVVLWMDHQLVALHFDDCALEQLFSPLAGYGRAGTGPDLDVIRAGDLDLLEAADAVVP